MAAQTVSIIGCGWLGLPLAEHLIRQHYYVVGSTTSVEKLPILRQKGINAYPLRLTPQPDGDIGPLLNTDTLMINVPPKAGQLGDAFHPRQIGYLTDSLRSSPIAHIIYVSSTSVYPELNRLMTEEDVQTEAQSAAPALVQAEELVQTLAADRTVTVLRCGGLMGYDRIPGKYVAGRTVNSGSVPVNYLHRDDAVGILTALIQQRPAGVFNAVAPEHPTREAVYRRSCAEFGYALPTFIEPAEPVLYKLISPAKLIQTTGYEFRYPNPLDFAYGL